MTQDWRDVSPRFAAWVAYRGAKLLYGDPHGHRQDVEEMANLIAQELNTTHPDHANDHDYFSPMIDLMWRRRVWLDEYGPLREAGVFPA
jgi:hypothetical protein